MSGNIVLQTWNLTNWVPEYKDNSGVKVDTVRQLLLFSSQCLFITNSSILQFSAKISLISLLISYGIYQLHWGMLTHQLGQNGRNFADNI